MQAEAGGTCCVSQKHAKVRWGAHAAAVQLCCKVTQTEAAPTCCIGQEHAKVPRRAHTGPGDTDHLIAPGLDRVTCPVQRLGGELQNPRGRLQEQADHPKDDAQAHAHGAGLLPPHDWVLGNACRENVSMGVKTWAVIFIYCYWAQGAVLMAANH